MASSSKRQKTNDRISNLPINLITRIFSFLSIDEIVRTSVLSTRWNQRWTSATHLDFDDEYVITKTNYATTSGASFLKFVYKVLLSKATCLDLFRLRCSRDYGATHVNTWLSAALSRHVRKIILDVPNRESQVLPDSLFTSRTLVVLILRRVFLARSLKTISLESLKILEFYSVEFEDCESLSRLISSCPVLEELEISHGEFRKSTMNVINISSLVLKRLYLFQVYFYDHQAVMPTLHLSYKVVLNTPSLERLAHLGPYDLVDGYEVDRLPCLDEACLSLYSYLKGLGCVHSAENFLRAIPNARSLYVSGSVFQALQRSNCELPTFSRLTKLAIGVIASDAPLSLLTAFLRSSPQLAYLSFALERSFYGTWDPPDTNVPICMQYNLNVIEVKCFSGQELELRLVKYFLENANCLKELIFPDMEKENVGIIKKVLMWARASGTCKIVLT